MKIIKIETINSNAYSGKYMVYFKPSWLERLFGKKPKEELFMDTGNTYPFAGCNQYMDSEGNLIGPCYINRAIDKYLRSLKFNQ